MSVIWLGVPVFFFTLCRRLMSLRPHMDLYPSSVGNLDRHLLSWVQYKGPPTVTGLVTSSTTCEVFFEGRVCWMELTYSMHRSPWEANKCPPPVPVLSQLDPVHAPASHFLNIHLNIIPQSTPGSSKWSLSLRFSHQNSIYASLLPHTCYMPPSYHSFWFDHPNSIGRGVQIMLNRTSFLNYMGEVALLARKSISDTLRRKWRNTPNQFGAGTALLEGRRKTTKQPR